MTEQNQSGISRRTLAKGAAWSVPAVAVAAAAPAYAVSTFITVTQAGGACKQPGDSCYKDFGYRKGYLQTFEICNRSNVISGKVTLPATATLLFNGTSTTFGIEPTEVEIAPNSCKYFIMNYQHTTSENASLSGIIDWTWEASDGTSGTGRTTIDTAATGPCKNCTTDVTVETTDPQTNVQERTVAEEPLPEEEPQVEEAKTTQVETTPKQETQPKLDVAPAETAEVTTDATPEATPAAEGEADA